VKVLARLPSVDEEKSITPSPPYTGHTAFQRFYKEWSPWYVEDLKLESLGV
jgi:hypothetical protein